MDDNEVTAIVHAIAVYLRANPLACDSTSGISSWWLQAHQQMSMKALQQALDWMKQQGAIEEMAGADGRTHYRRRGSDEALDAAVAARGAMTVRRGWQ